MFNLKEKPEIVLVPAVFVFFTLLWENVVNLLEVSETILPTPSRIFDALLVQIDNPIFWKNVGITTQEALLGILLCNPLRFGSRNIYFTDQDR